MRGRIAATIVPLRYARMLAGALCAVAIALPWAAAHQGLVRFDAQTSTAMAKPIRFRPDMVELPGGPFVMGSPPTEKDRSDDETQHSVTVAPFAMFRTEVTLAQWEAVMGTRPNDCEYGCEDTHPVQRVSMLDALRYANRLTDKENALLDSDKPPLTRCYDETNWSWDRACTGYRLPTEAEWEYAARAGTTTAYSFGDDPKDLCTFGNFADASAKRAHPGWNIVYDPCDDRDPNLAPVGSFAANPWGLYDMHGNVWEWVWDKFAPYADKSVTSGSGTDTDTDADTDKPSDNVSADDRRVLRGGSFFDGPWGLRSAFRWLLPSLSVGFSGFRCVRGHVASH